MACLKPFVDFITSKFWLLRSLQTYDKGQGCYFVVSDEHQGCHIALSDLEDYTV